MSGSGLLPVLRLLRVGTLFSPAADVVVSVAVLGLAWDAVALRAVAASVCLYAAGMVLNDLVDRRQDARTRPERPLVRGELTPTFAFVLTLALLGAGLALSPCRAWHGLLAALVVAYDLVLKRVDWLGACGMAALRGLNLATALAIAEAAAIETPAAAALRTAAICYALYIAAVTLLGCYEDRSDVPARATASLLVVPPLAAWVGIFAVQDGFWPAPVLAVAPVIWFARQNARTKTFDRAVIRTRMTWLLLGTMLFTALLALAAGRWPEALLVLVAILPARWISRRIALT